MDAPTILVIEDNPVTRKMLRVTLESENFRVLEAGDGRTALALLDVHRPDLVLQDLILPDMDGLELVQRLRSRAPGAALPILALSGFLSRLEESRTTEAGFSALLVKPIEPPALIEAISAYLPNARRPRSPANAPHQIMVVDDDAVQLKLTRVQLTNLGFSAMAAGSVPEALRLARRSPPHLILSDVFMPGTDGFQLCMEVRQDPALAAVPVVLVSAYYGTREDHDLARRVGATALVMRTPGFPELERVVRSALTSGAPAVAESPHDQITLSHAKAVIRQLEQQLAGLSGLTQRVALQAAQLSLLGGVADALTRKTDIDAALRDVLAATLDAAGISKGALMLLEGDGTLRVRPAIGFSDAELRALPHFFGHLALLNAIIARGASVTAPSSAIAQEAGEEILRGAGVESLQIVPLIASGVPMGALVIGASRTDVTANDSVAFARAIGNQIVQTLQLSKSVASLSASEQRYRTLLDRASDAIAVLGTDGVVREVNQRWERLLMRRRDEIVGRRMSEFAAPGRADETLAASTGPDAADGSAIPVELLRADGATVRVEL